MNSRALEIAAAIAQGAAREGLPVDSYLAEEQARIEAIGRGMRRPKSATIECQDCAGTGTTDVIVGGWEHPKTREEKCEHCDDDGQVLCGCGAPATVEISSGNFYCDECLAQDWAAGFEACVLARLP